MQASVNPISFRIRSLLLFCIVALLTFDSCKNKQHVVENNTVDTSRCKIDRRLAHPLINDMRKSEFKFEWYSSKLDCEASFDSSKYQFDITVRMRRDSVIWMMITDPVIGIPVARVLITKDSVKFIQKMPEEKCFRGDFTILSQLLQTEVDFEMIQSLLVGNSTSFYEEDEKLRSSINKTECTYTLSTIRKRKLNRVLDNDKPLKEPLQTISLDPLSFKILKILFLDAQNRTFTATYGEFAEEDSMLLPHKAEFFARGVQKSAKLDVSYKKVRLNQPLEFPFSFPEDCKPILINEQPQPPQQAPQPQGQH